MNKFLGLALFPFAWGVVFTIYFLATTAPVRPPTFFWWVLSAALFSAAATWTTAGIFGWRDRMRWAWLCRAVLFTLTVVTILTSPERVSGTAPVTSVRVALSLTNNMLNVVSTLLFVLAWSQANIALPMRNLAVLVGFALGAAVAGPTWWVNAFPALQGDYGAAIRTISATGDILTISLLGALMASAWFLRGGAFMWPYLLLVFESLVWLVYDLAALFDPANKTTVSTIVLFFAWPLTGCAALAHRWVIRDASR